MSAAVNSDESIDAREIVAISPHALALQRVRGYKRPRIGARKARNSLVEQAARYEEVKIPLREPVHGLEAVSGTLGVPEWWPTGSRICLLIAHGAQIEDPLLEGIARELTERKCLTLRFLLPHVEANKKRVDPPAVMRRVFMAAASLVSRDPTAAPAHIFVGGKNQGALAAAHAANGRLRENDAD